MGRAMWLVTMGRRCQLVAFIGYFAFVSLFATSVDIKSGMQNEATKHAHNIELCVQKYFDNHCDVPADRALALLDKRCGEWELCMK